MSQCSCLAAWRTTRTWRSGKRAVARRECVTNPTLIVCFGNGYSAEAKRISLGCKELRRVVRFVHKRQLDTTSHLCLALAADGVELPDVHADESAVVEQATAIIKRKRLELQGRSRAQLILNSGDISGKSQESKQRAATKRDVNAVVERSVRGAVASVTVGAGDGAEDRLARLRWRVNAVNGVIAG